MSHSPIEWWTLHRNSPGMDGASKRALLGELIKQRDYAAHLRATLNPGESLKMWDEIFADDAAAVIATIKEIEDSLQ